MRARAPNCKVGENKKYLANTEGVNTVGFVCLRDGGVVPSLILRHNGRSGSKEAEGRKDGVKKQPKVGRCSFLKSKKKTLVCRSL